MTNLSSTALVLAAGIGQRMRPLTLNKPKPLQTVGGRTMLDAALDKLIAAGLRRAVVNAHYLAEQIEEHLKTRTDIEIVVSREETLLDTGGGIAKALPYFEGKPFFALNADLPWMDEGTPSLLRLKDAWTPETMDVLLLVTRRERARGFSANGDFDMAPSGQLRRKDAPAPRPYVMTAAQIVTPAPYLNRAGKIFSNRDIWDEAEARGRLYGLEHKGTCYHVGTPEDLRQANKLLASGKGWAT